jgi:4-aminobutyrate aminotransferase-like enzyme/Ser/Thr protein kinase RdoA (MazF antagonist)/murein DD-endopeptidase MepM/ murein hydrolase activator NlpD
VLSRARPRFRATEAERIARESYGVEAKVVSELPSERDQNFHLREPSGRELVLKIASSSEPRSVLDFQNQALERISRRDPGLPIPRLRPTFAGAAMALSSDGNGGSFLCRLFDHLPGRPLAAVRPHPQPLLSSVGNVMGRLDAALAGFTHEEQKRYLKWNTANAPAVVGEALALVEDPARRDLLRHFLKLIDDEVAPGLASLPRGVIHNDANDHNLLVSEGEVSAILDFGDMVESALACELANACAYVMFGKTDPLRAARAVVAGYHRARPLGEDEVKLLFPLIATRLAMSVSISARQFRDEPEKEYLRVSEASAWSLLEWLKNQSPRFAHYGFRAACGMAPHPRAAALAAHLQTATPASVLPWELSSRRIHVFDLSVGTTAIGGLDLLEDVSKLTEHLFSLMKEEDAALGVGRYDEARVLYTTEAFRPGSRQPARSRPSAEGRAVGVGPHGIEERGEPRTVHLGIDLFVEAGTEVRAPLAGRIHSFAFNDAPLDYGPTIILEHEAGDGDRFYTLYGHLSLDSLEGLERGKNVSRGEAIAWVGSYPANGNWPPHLHFQIVLDLLDKEGDFPGVAAPSEREIWLGLSPNPARLLGLPDAARAPRDDREGLLRRRREWLSSNLSLSYREPLHIVRGYGVFLYDSEGRRYLDMVNNVCHVGHANPRVVRALSLQAAVLNTNTRYLHRNVLALAERLTSLLPPSLEVAFFVNSGSEANDLALRLARAHTGRKTTLVLDGSYHGNLTSLIEVSPYKFDGPGGEGAPPHVHKLDMPDGYRGRHRRSDREYGERYVEDARRVLSALASRGTPAGAVIAEAILSCGGQVVLPPGYLASLFREVRSAGGVAIADEVQLGFGRVGTRFWGFDSEEAIPDIVTMGKPFGNGHPLGAVVTTREVARSFQTGMEYFNTFGGNPVSCAAGLAVLDVLADQHLQEKARAMGEVLLAGIRSLQSRNPILGDVRGRGLFLGFEMVKDPDSLEPAASEASALVDRMKEEGVLLSTEGPLHNVIKVKPPLVFESADADFFLTRLERVLEEDRFQI